MWRKPMRRRDFIALLGGSAAASPLAAHAQQATKVTTIGFLGNDASVWNSWTTLFVQRLRELGWTEGGTVAIVYRWHEGRREREAEFAAEFVRLKVDVMSRRERAQPQQRKRIQSFPSCLHWRQIRSGTAWLPAWRDRAGTSPDYRFRVLIWPASGLNSC